MITLRRSFHACIFLALTIVPDSVSGQATTVTLQQAIDTAMQNNLELKIQNFTREKSRALRQTASEIPSPSLSLYRDNLGSQGMNAGEYVITAQLPLDFLWTRRARIAAAESHLTELEYSLAHQRQVLRFEVQKAFVESHYLHLKSRSWQDANAIFRDAMHTITTRMQEGDIAGYDRERMALASVQYQTHYQEALYQWRQRARRLAFLLNAETGSGDIDVAHSPPKLTGVPPLQNLLVSALANRRDLQAATARFQVGKAVEKVARREALPALDFGLGYKRQVDGFQGLVTQINIGLPFFSKNKGAVQHAHVSLLQEQTRIAFLEHTIRTEVERAHQRYQLYRQLVEQMSDASVSPNRVLDIARFSYAEGNMTVLELLDAVRSSNDFTLAQLDVSLQYELSLYALEMVTATAVYTP